MTLGLYVHVPFCAAICNYCNFNRGLYDAAVKVRYVDALVAEIARSGEAEEARGAGRAGRGGRAGGAGRAGRAADTIFFGGGTPSLLEPDEIGRIVDACRTAFAVEPTAEVTLEANPETVTRDRLAQFRDAGINRLSFGVQSFRDDELKRLSRLHGADRAAEAFAESRGAGFDNVSLDLMMWLPGQRVSEWLHSVDRAIALGPEHLSLYLLEVYPNSPLRDTMARARWSQAPDDDAAAMYVTAMERLEQAGYTQYEISNVARPGREARHNRKYWTDGEWLGFGCGAHSTMNGARWKNISGTEEYITRIEAHRSAAVDRHDLTPDERLGDALFTGLRLTDGLDEAAVQARYGVNLWARFGAELTPFVETGLLVRKAGRIRLTREGMLLAHEVMTIFV